MGYSFHASLLRHKYNFLRRLPGRIEIATALVLTTTAIGPLCAQDMPKVATNGVVPIPSDPPPTGITRPVPVPAGSLQNPQMPLGSSPSLQQVTSHGPERPITLTEAMAIALTTNRSLAFAGESLLFAEGRTKEARSALYPTVGLAPADTFQAHELEPAYGVQATLPIDISGLLRAATDQAQFQEVQTRLEINGTRNQIVSDTASAFYASLRAQALVTVAVENLQNSLDRLKDAQVRYSAQAVAYYDVVRAQTDVANAQKQVIQARNAVSVSIAQLNSTMGIDVTTPLRITVNGAVEEPPGVAPPNAAELTPAMAIQGAKAIPESALPAAPPSVAATDNTEQSAQAAEQVIGDALRLGPAFQSVLSEAMATRPEVLEADAGISAAHKGIVVARRSVLPSLAVSVGYYDERNLQGTTRINEPQAFIGLSIPIFDGGTARARVQEAKSTVSSAVTNKRDITDAVTLDVEQSYLNLVQARDQVAVANQNLAQARTTFALARVRYNAGVASKAGISPLLEVSDAQAALTLSEQNQVNALYDYNAARAQLDRSVGRYAYVLNGPGYNKPPAPHVVGVPTH